MSSNATPTAEVRPFPNAKIAPATEAPNAPTEPAISPQAEAPTKKKRSARSLLLPIIALGLLGAAAWYGYDYWTDGRFM
ncbi:MAG: HlyD family secretion protein, partial [Mesorhizobium sp.]